MRETATTSSCYRAVARHARAELVLERHDLLVALVEALCERNHDVALLQQQLLVPVHLGLLFLDRLALPLELHHACDSLTVRVTVSV